MDFYDIHTHDAPVPTDEEEQSQPCILNVYPLGFEDAKDASLGCSFSCGVHPWYSENSNPQISFLEEIAGDRRIVAIGEAGYDKLKGPDMQTQKIAFEKQVELSERLQKPLIIHCIKAWDELFASQKKYKPTQAWIIHGYKGKPELTRQLLKHGFKFSFGEKYNRESLSIIPMNSIFCETDVSDISIVSVYENLSEDLGISVEELCSQVEQNIMEIFPQLIPVNV